MTGACGLPRGALWSDVLDDAPPDYSADPFAPRPEEDMQCVSARAVASLAAAADMDDIAPAMAIGRLSVSPDAAPFDYAPAKRLWQNVDTDSAPAAPASDAPEPKEKPDGPPVNRRLTDAFRAPPGRETDRRRLQSRQKQIDYGKNTEGYRRYRAAVPRERRVRGTHPATPRKEQLCSKRSWDGQVSKWRRMLHAFDPAPGEADAPQP